MPPIHLSPKKSFSLWILAAGLAGALATVQAAVYQPDLGDVPKPDVDAQMESFLVHEGFEVNLFAANPDINKPIQINFDTQGRLWVVSSDLYPHIEPGQKANDKIYVLEDTDQDGVADKSTVFADGLHIPTGIVPGDGGVYVANSVELLFLSDTDGDGKADSRRTVLSGFGTEDTHHILHTLRWGFDGNLYMNQSIYIHSHIETPYGPQRLMGSGIWRFRPETLELDVFMRGLVNPWGHHYDRYGQSFATDGAGGEGINYVVPGAYYVTAVGAERILQGLNPGSPKHCGLEMASGGHLPEDWRGSFMTCDFRARRVCRFEVTENGSGYASTQKPEILKTDFVSFRPVDIKMGPDGAIYIADFYNPIIQHGEVDFRDPRRDHEHGRIWRVSAKGRDLVRFPDLVGMETSDLFDLLLSKEGFTREKTRRILKERGKEEVLPAVAKWVEGLSVDSDRREESLLEALWVYQSLDAPNPELLDRVLAAEDGRIRAAAVRVLSQWKQDLESPLDLLAKTIEDEHPRVRLESVRALGDIPQTRSAQLAATVLEHPLDEYLDYALWLSLRELEVQWLPRVQAGETVFGENISHLTFALRAINSPSALQPLISLIEEKKIPAEQEGEILALIADLGGPGEMAMILDLVYAMEEDRGQERIDLLSALVTSAKKRKVFPDRGGENIVNLFASEDETLKSLAVEAAGLWKVESARQPLAELAEDPAVSAPVRAKALQAVADMGGELAREVLEKAAQKSQPIDWRMAAAVAMTSLDATAGARLVASVLGDLEPGRDPSVLFHSILAQKEGPGLLAEALEGKDLPADTAKVGVRMVAASGQSQPKLMGALIQAGGLSESKTTLNQEEMEAVVAAVKSAGDPAAGEAIFRKESSQCLLCHAIAGSGGLVGPDLTTIGASAQIDYLVTSMLNPSDAIKEGYHSIVINTVDEEVFSGIRVRETEKEVVIRDQNDQEVAIPKADIESVTDGLSLMPTGLADFLTQEEFRDLVAFLSALGKEGEYGVGTERYVRTWESWVNTPQGAERLRIEGDRALLGDSPEMAWTSRYSAASGRLPLAELPEVVKQWKDDPHSFVRFDLEVSSPGQVALKLNSPQGLRMWLGQEPLEVAERVELSAGKGTHTVTVSINRAERQEDLLIELVQAQGQEVATVQLVGGK